MALATKFITRFFIALVILIFSLYCAVWLFSPLITRVVLGDFLESYSAQVEENSTVRLNPFKSQLSVKNLQLLKEGAESLSLDTLQIRYSVFRLFSKDIVVHSLKIKGLNIDIEKRGDELNIAGVVVPLNSSEPQEPEENSDDEGPVDIRVFAPEVVIEDVSVNFVNEGHPHSLHIETLKVADSRYVKERLTSNVNLSASVDGANIDLTSHIDISQALMKAGLELNAKNVSPKSVLYLLPETISELALTSNVKLSAELAMKDKLITIKSQKLDLTAKGLVFNDGQNSLVSDKTSVAFQNDGISINLQEQKLDSGLLQALTVQLPKPDLKVVVDGLKLLAPGIELETSLADLAFQGDTFALAMHSDIEGENSTVNIDLQENVLDIKADAFKFADKALAVDFDSTELAWKGARVSFDQSSQSILVQGEPALSLMGFNSVLLDGQQTLLNLGKFETEVKLFLQDEDLQLSAPSVLFQELLFSEVDKNKGLPALVSLNSLSLSDLVLEGSSLSLRSVDIGGGELGVALDKKGALSTLVDFSALSAGDEGDTDDAKPQPTVPSEDASQESPQKFAIESITLSEPLKISIDDSKKGYSFKKVFKLTKLDLKSIDSNKIEQKSDFVIQLKDEQFFVSDVSGWVKPFSEKLDMDVKGAVKEFPLYEVAPYLRDSLGFEVEAGQLDMDLAAAVKRDNMKGKAKLLMRGAKFKSSQKANDETNLIGQTAIPLNVALNMLRDGDGNIKLKIPVSGKVDDPNFGLEYIVGLVLKKVALQQAKSHLMTTFVPYAKVVSIALSAGEQALKVRFQDLPYQPGQLELGEEHQEFLEQFNLLMVDKKGLQVRVCPIATAADMNLPLGSELSEEQYQSLLELAKQRGINFKSRVVETSGVDSSRILLCTAKVDSGKKALPRIDFKT